MANNLRKLLEEQRKRTGQAASGTGVTGSGTAIDVPRPVTETQGSTVLPDDAPDWLRQDQNADRALAQQAYEARGGNLGAVSPSTGGNAQQATGTTSGSGIPKVGAYDPTGYAAYNSAMQALQEAQGGKPVYYDSYGDQLNALVDKIVNRDPFTYDLGSDMLYQQYRDQAMANGRLAMQDTMGRAAALTGGYGSTYSQQVGQQAYDAYLRTLNEQIPTLYGQALSAYNAEGDRLAQNFSILANQQNQEYSRYRDSMSDYWNGLNYATDRVDTAYNQGYQQWQSTYNSAWDQYNAQLAQDQLAYSRESDSYDRMMQLITNTGYQPSPEELEAAGMSQQQADAWKNYYDIQQALAQQKTAGGYSSSGSSRRSYSSDPDDELSATDMSMLDYMKSLGTDQAAYFAAQSYAAQNTPNERQYKAIMDEYDYWFNNLSENETGAGGDEQENDIDWSKVRSSVVDNAAMELSQITDVAVRYNRLEQMLKQGIINEEEEWVLYQNLMQGYEPPAARWSSGKYGNGGR